MLFCQRDQIIFQIPPAVSGKLVLLLQKFDCVGEPIGVFCRFPKSSGLCILAELLIFRILFCKFLNHHVDGLVAPRLCLPKIPFCAGQQRIQHTGNDAAGNCRCVINTVCMVGQPFDLRRKRSDLRLIGLVLRLNISRQCTWRKHFKFCLKRFAFFFQFQNLLHIVSPFPDVFAIGALFQQMSKSVLLSSVGIIRD